MTLGDAMAHVLIDWLNNLAAKPTVTHDDIRFILDEIDEEAEAYWFKTRDLEAAPKYAE